MLKVSGQGILAAKLAPLVPFTMADPSLRCINVVNFIRGVEPRGPMDLMLPVANQMEILLEHKLPVTWLLQYDALVSGPFVAYLKANMRANHEVGAWFEINELHCKAAGVEWRGRPGYEWDHLPHVAFTIGYTPEERIKLADAFMVKFKELWKAYPASVASWNLDSITMAHLTERYGVDAFAVCRDQIATDGFTIWGAPIAGYYPSKTNCWSPALERKNQLASPVFRMLGQDPVYYYENGFPMPEGKRGSGPDTMEPVWPSGRSPEFIKNFLDMIANQPTLGFAYAQLGQENNFGWPEMAEAFPLQMKALADLRSNDKVHIETMGESGRRFKKEFRETPAQAQVMLKDPFGNTDRVERSIWYQSRFYRADLHLKGDLPYLRDLTVYSDHNPQPFLRKATRETDVEQRMPAVLDGYHWSKTPGSSEPGAGGYFMADGGRLRMTGEPVVRQDGSSLSVELAVTGGKILRIRFEEESMTLELTPSQTVELAFEWYPSKAALKTVQPQSATFEWLGFGYTVQVTGMAKTTSLGWTVMGPTGKLALDLAQRS